MVRLDPMFHALADPTRRWIIEQLLDGRASVSWLAARHPMSLTAFMRHVHVLERCSMVLTLKEGRCRTCYIDTGPLQAAEYWIRRALWRDYRNRLGSLPVDWLQARVVCPRPSSNCSISSSSESIGAEQTLPRQR